MGFLARVAYRHDTGKVWDEAIIKVVHAYEFLYLLDRRRAWETVDSVELRCKGANT